MSKIAAVTGATGFVGPHLVAALARHGWTPRLLVRRMAPVPSLAGIEAELVFGDLEDDAALHRLVEGADAVVHTAGLIKARDVEDFFRVNRDGTARLSALASNAFFLLLSSIAAREPQLSAYAASKQAAEVAVAARSGRWLTVRAPAVYGPGDRETLAYFKAAERGWAPSPAGTNARLSLIHVIDLVEALVLALGQPPEPGIYEIDDGKDGAYGYLDMATAAGAALGRRPQPVSISRSLLTAIAWTNAIRQRLGAAPQILTVGKVAEMFHPDWAVHDRRLAEQLGFAAQYGLTEGFADTVRWYRGQGWLRNP